MAEGQGGAGRVASGTELRRRFELALRAGAIGTFRWIPGTGELDLDLSCAELLGLAPDAPFEAWRDNVHASDRPRTLAALEAAAAGRIPEFRSEYRYLRPDGVLRWMRGVGRMDPGAGGEEMLGVVADITETRMAEMEREAARAAERVAQEAAAASQRRLHLLARAATLLDSPLDLDLVLQDVADLAVAELADWCAVDLVDDRDIRHAAVAHRDPAMVALAHEMHDRYPPDADDPGLRRVLDTLEPLYFPEIGDDVLVAGARDAEHLHIMRSLAMSSAVSVPLQTRGRAFGVMTLIGCDGRRITTEDRDLAVELGRRAGAAVDKARLYAERDRVATTLQRSLLPPMLPVVPGLALGAHYRPATANVDIGGDFYDVFRTQADRWWIALGDVCGKGPEAAALTGAIRHVLRAVTADVEDPALALRRLNEGLLGQDWAGRFATLVVLTFRPPTDGRLVVSATNGGHPPLLLRRAGGAVETVDAHGMLVGLLPDVAYTSSRLELAAGDAILLYTDGATEARRPDGSELGEEPLKALLRDAPPSAPQLVDHLAVGLERATGGRGLRDDLALLALTVTRPS